VVRGEVEPEGNNVRVSVRLDDRSGVSLKKVSITRPADNPIAMRDTLAVVASDLIRQQLGQELSLKEQASVAGNANAWLLVQRGQQAQREGETLNAKGDSAGLARAFATADSLYAAAQSVDARWAQPTVLRANLAFRRARMAGREAIAIRKWVTVGLEHAQHAVELDRSSADAYEARGTLRYFGWLAAPYNEAAKQKADLVASKADLDTATSLNPRQAGAWATLAHLHNNFPGSTATDAYLAAEHAWTADEFLANANQILQRLFNASFDAGQYAKAEQWCNTGRQRFPADVRVQRCQIYLQTMREGKPDPARAWRLADSAVALVAPAARPYERLLENMLVAAVLARASKQQPALADSARHVVQQSAGDAQVDAPRELAYFGAFVRTVLGDKDDAIRLLKVWLAANPGKAADLREDPGWMFKELTTDPRFVQLVGTR
jgi:serine/threonine-protein kinase